MAGELPQWLGNNAAPYGPMTSSAQPGCTLVKMDFLLAGEDARRIHREGPEALEARIRRGPLAALYGSPDAFDFKAGIDVGMGDGGGGLNDDNAAAAMQIVSKDACVCSCPPPPMEDMTEKTTETTETAAAAAAAVSVVLRLPCRLPPGGKIECRARGCTFPVHVTEMAPEPRQSSSSSFRSEAVLARVLVPCTGLEGAALLEMVQGDGTPIGGISPAVLLLARDAEVAEGVNRALDILHAPDDNEAPFGAPAAAAAAATATKPTRETLFSLGMALAGRTPPAQTLSMTAWACSLPDRRTIALAEHLLALYPPRDKLEAATVLFHAVLSRQLLAVDIALDVIHGGIYLFFSSIGFFFLHFLFSSAEEWWRGISGEGGGCYGYLVLNMRNNLWLPPTRCHSPSFGFVVYDISVHDFFFSQKRLWSRATTHGMRSQGRRRRR